MPSLSFINNSTSRTQRKQRKQRTQRRSTKRSIETRPLSCMTHIAITQPPHLQQHGVLVAVDEDLEDLELVAGRLALRPQRVARAAEKRRVSGAPRFGERLLV